MHTLFARLVDDAALFPPGNAPMAAAVPGHREATSGPYRWLVGRFLCPASRITELQQQLQPEDMIELGLIADTGLDGLPEALRTIEQEKRVRLSAIEIALPKDADQARAAAVTLAALPEDEDEDVTAYIELPRVPGWREALDRVSAAKRAAKLRTGGLTAELFPTPQEVAGFIEACAERNTPFKCTAGLHHAIRHTDEATGFTHHGFLNILLATGLAMEGKDAVAALTSEDGPSVARAVQDHLRARELFTGYGSCSLAEPIDDLEELGLLGRDPT